MQGRRRPILLLPALLLLLSMPAAVVAFIRPCCPRPLQRQGQHSRQPMPPHAPRQPPRPRRMVLAAAAAAAASAEGDAARENDEQQAKPSTSAPIKPRAFATKRMRRGPLGPNSSSPSSSSTTQQPAAATAATGSSAGGGPEVLKLSKQWACVAGCGACCYLAPEERPYLMDYFEDPEDLALYNSMVGDDGWCTHYDKTARACTVFADRPWFCRVEQESFKRMYDVEAHEMDRFCTGCCREQIGDVYGSASAEMLTFNMAIKALKAEARQGSGKPKGFGAAAVPAAVGAGVGGGGGSSSKVVVPVDPFTHEQVGEEKVRADWV